ncbi:MAG: peptide chain release factor N(5)-glutamine methyltransferase [Bacteroidales bacterium]
MYHPHFKENTIREVYQWFKSSLTFTNHHGELSAVTNEVFYRFLGITADRRVTDPRKKVSSSTIDKLKRTLERLNQYEPVQYITGITEFDGLPIHVRPGVLIPRPETEELVQWINTHLQYQESDRIRYAPILDIGTGSGCIAIALASRLPGNRVKACDVSEVSLEVAKHNALLNKVDIELFSCDLMDDKTRGVLPSSLGCIVSNPPYVTESEKSEMARNVLDHEPAEALYVPDNDPLLYYRMIAKKASAWLFPGGYVFLEINEKFSEETLHLLVNHGFTDIVCRCDIHNKDRFILARKPGK